MKLSQIARFKGAEKFGRNSSMILFSRKNNNIQDSMHVSDLDIIQPSQDQVLKNLSQTETTQEDELLENMVGVNAVSMAIE